MILALSLAGRGQVASWLIPPVYDDINKVRGAELLVTDSLKKKILWMILEKIDTKELD